MVKTDNTVDFRAFHFLQTGQPSFVAFKYIHQREHASAQFLTRTAGGGILFNLHDSKLHKSTTETGKGMSDSGTTADMEQELQLGVRRVGR
jgi:hypothetical protein